MIRLASIEDILGIFDLFRRTYKSHSLLEIGELGYKEMISDGEYVGFIFIERNQIIGHAGVAMGDNFTLINCLVTDKKVRGKGIGRQLFKTRETFCDGYGKDFTVGYSMMQHLHSQLLYSDAFRPIGMVIDYPDIYNENNKQLNRGISNAEMVLCKRNSPRIPIEVKVPQISPANKLYLQILKTMCVEPNYTSAYELQEDDVFLGLVPNTKSGLFTFNVTKRNPIVNFDLMLTTNAERESFKNEIRKNH